MSNGVSMNGGGWTDSHCHLGDDADAAVAEARRGGVTRLIDVGTSVGGSIEAVNRSRSTPGVFATAGVHPHEASDGLDGLADVASCREVVAVGECGLDYHYLHSPVAAQRRVFAEQIGLARALGKPVVIHSRSAWDDTFDVATAEHLPGGSVFHCFTGGANEARRCLDLGAFLSFSGIVTFRSADDVREAAAMCPLDRMLVETDSPFLAPVPHRGRANRPALVSVVGEFIADQRAMPAAELAEITTANAARAFGLDEVLERSST